MLCIYLIQIKKVFLHGLCMHYILALLFSTACSIWDLMDGSSASKYNINRKQETENWTQDDKRSDSWFKFKCSKVQHKSHSIILSVLHFIGVIKTVGQQIELIFFYPNLIVHWHICFPHQKEFDTGGILLNILAPREQQIFHDKTSLPKTTSRKIMKFMVNFLQRLLVLWSLSSPILLS